jgi:circadian clock protein KaiC
VRSIAHAVIVLDQATKDYGAERRRVHVAKYRGVAFRGGMHDYAIIRGGLVVYPRLVASDTRVLGVRKQVTTSLSELDQLLGGGLEEGSSTLVAGPPGTGKSTLAAQFAYSAMKRGERAAMFLFEESANQLLNRMDGFNMGLRSCVDSGQLIIQQIDPAELSPGEFANKVCEAALNGARVIVIDSMNGYLNAMPDERFLTTHLHELLTFLGQKGVITILVGVQSGMLGASMTTSVDASYLADNVIMLRYFESNAEVRQAISVFKKRASAHERTIRQFEITRQGIQIGEPLRGFHGILTGVPTYIGDALSGQPLAGVADD